MGWIYCISLGLLALVGRRALGVSVSTSSAEAKEVEVKIIKGCGGGRSGVFSDALNCTRYIQCPRLGSKPIPFACFPGFVYNPCEKACTWDPEQKCIPVQSCAEKLGYLFLPTALENRVGNLIHSSSAGLLGVEASAEDESVFAMPDDEIQIVKASLPVPKEMAAEVMKKEVVKEAEAIKLRDQATAAPKNSTTLEIYIVRVVFGPSHKSQLKLDLPDLQRHLREQIDRASAALNQAASTERAAAGSSAIIDLDYVERGSGSDSDEVALPSLKSLEEEPAIDPVEHVINIPEEVEVEDGDGEDAVILEGKELVPGEALLEAPLPGETPPVDLDLDLQLPLTTTTITAITANADSQTSTHSLTSPLTTTSDETTQPAPTSTTAEATTALEEKASTTSSIAVETEAVDILGDIQEEGEIELGVGKETLEVEVSNPTQSPSSPRVVEVKTETTEVCGIPGLAGQAVCSCASKRQRDELGLSDPALLSSYCSSLKCLNGGMFIWNFGQCGCMCKSGFRGIGCEEAEAAEAERQPCGGCANGGKCVALRSGEEACQCPIGFIGGRCEFSVQSEAVPKTEEISSSSSTQLAHVSRDEYSPEQLSLRLAVGEASRCENGGLAFVQPSTGERACFCSRNYAGSDCGTFCEECALRDSILGRF